MFLSIKSFLCISVNNYMYYVSTVLQKLGVPKRYQRLINDGTKVFCIIFRISFILHNAYFYLDFEIKIVEMR